MATYTTKPFEIQAVRFTGENWWEILAFVGVRQFDDDWHVPNFAPVGEYARYDDDEIVASVYDKLHHTWVGVKAGQYIIKGQKGEFYPCDPDIFEAKYELKYKETDVLTESRREETRRARNDQ